MVDVPNDDTYGRVNAINYEVDDGCDIPCHEYGAPQSVDIDVNNDQGMMSDSHDVANDVNSEAPFNYISHDLVEQQGMNF